MASRRTPESTPAKPASVAAPKKPGRGAKSTSAPAVAAAPAVSAAVKPRAPVARKKPVRTTQQPLKVSADERRGMIAKAAYLRAERRGFAYGGEADDWLQAENEIDALLSGGGAAQ